MSLFHSDRVLRLIEHLSQRASTPFVYCNIAFNPFACLDPAIDSDRPGILLFFVFIFVLFFASSFDPTLIDYDFPIIPTLDLANHGVFPPDWSNGQGPIPA